MKKIGALIISLSMLFTLLACQTNTEKDKVKIGIVQISEHESLNIIREACIKQLEQLGYNEDNATIIYKNAGGDASTLKTIMEQMQSDEVDVLVPISTPCAQAAAPYAEKIPVVFAAVSDPMSAKLSNSLKTPNLNITGTSNAIQVDQILDFGLQLYPNVKTLGILYNPGEVNSLSSINKAKEYAKQHGITIIESGITNASEVQDGTQSLVNKVDAIFIPNDNTIINAMDVVSNITKEAKIPTFCGVDTFVKSGGLLNVGIDYTKLGKETADMVHQIIEGTNVKDIPIKEYKSDLNIYINKTTAKALGLDVDSIQNKKDIIYFE